MKTIEIKLYSFDELSDEAKQKALDNYRNKNYDNSFYYDEINSSVEAVIELFNLKTGRDYSDIRTGHIDDCILELSGARLYKWLINNHYSDLFKGKYIKTLDRKLYCKQFICKHFKNHKGEDYTQLYSKVRFENSCVLTGVCYDEDILQPIYDFLKRPDKSVDYSDLIRGIESAIRKTYDNTEEWLNSDEYIIEEFEANEYDFTIDGKIY
jgi:hypothetical protein